MRYFQHITANVITGVIIGEIFLLPLLGWLYSGHGLIELWWTKQFLIIGLVWGVACGIAVGLVPIMINSKISTRIIIGVVVGGLAGIIFYLIGDLAFLTKDSLSETLLKSIFGGILGAFSGGISAFFLGIFNWLLKWINVDDVIKEENEIKKPQLKERILSSLVGVNVGMVIGGFLLVVLGQTLLLRLAFLYFNMIVWFYLLPIMLGCFLAIYAFAKALPKHQLQKSINGLRYGITFSLMFVLYFGILLLIIIYSPLPKPEVVLDNFWLDFVPGVVIVFTMLFGLSNGVTGAVFEGFWLEWRTKQKNAA